MKALIIVDVQNDFCPGGTLPCRKVTPLVPVINRLQADYDLVVATQDWHPANHGSFAANHPGREPASRSSWPGCRRFSGRSIALQHTPGKAFHPGLNLDRVARVFRKGMDPAIDSYSGFFDNGHRAATGLAEFLRDWGVEEVHVCGLATDYCVKFTALDAVGLGFPTTLLADACRGVELHPGDVRQAIEEMRRQGVTVSRSLRRDGLLIVELVNKPDLSRAR